MNLRSSALAIGLTLLGSSLANAQSTVSIDFNIDNQLRRVVIKLDESAAPQTCQNFQAKVGSGAYNGMAVHRAIPNFLVQMGDPLSRKVDQKHLWGTGGGGETIPAEINGKMTRGSVAMARLPDSRNPSKASNGSQFFIALADLTNLDGKYTVFGRVVNGIEHLDYMGEQTADTNDVPLKRIELAATSLVRGDGTVVSSKATPNPMAGVAAAASVARDKVTDAIPDRIPVPKKPDLSNLPSLPKLSAPSLPKISRPSLPKLSKAKLPSLRIGRGKKEAKQEEADALENAAAELAMAEETPAPSATPAVEQKPAVKKQPTVSVPTDDRPLSDEELLAEAAEVFSKPPTDAELFAEAAIPAPSEEEAAPMESLADNSKLKKKMKLSIPVPKKSKDGKEGIVSRAIKRVW